MMILIPAATGATSFDINRVSTFIETRSMRSRSSSSGKLWTRHCIESSSRRILSGSVRDRFGDWGGETLSFGIRRWSVRRGWRGEAREAHEALFLQLLVAYSGGWRINLPHSARLRRGSRFVWVGIWNSNSRVRSRATHILLRHSSIPPQAPLWQSTHPSGASLRCCYPQVQCCCTRECTRVSRVRRLPEYAPREAQSCPHWHYTVLLTCCAL